MRKTSILLLSLFTLISTSALATSKAKVLTSSGLFTKLPKKTTPQKYKELFPRTQRKSHYIADAIRIYQYTEDPSKFLVKEITQLQSRHFILTWAPSKKNELVAELGYGSTIKTKGAKTQKWFTPSIHASAYPEITKKLRRLYFPDSTAP